MAATSSSSLPPAAELVEGGDSQDAIERLFAPPDAAYRHAPEAKFGCFVARIDRA